MRQYLDRHAEPEVAIATAVTRRFGHVLAIPAAGEGASLHDVLSSIPVGPLGDVLVILVVNASVDSPRWISDANLALFERLYRDWGAGHSCASLGRLYDRPHGALLLVDRAAVDRKLPAKQGVGLARKIGADLALALWQSDRIESPWIHCTDADVVLPSDYFEQPMSASPDASALAYRYRHVPENVTRNAHARIAPHATRTEGSLSRAALEYEISLRYYVRGLSYAGSPFAFHTIGSTMAVRASAYAQTRGFPRRLAAEDFYLLNKLAKVGRVDILTGLPIDLSSRLSQRVPFGTGRALTDARRMHGRPLYHPAVFDYLAAWQSTLLAIAHSPETQHRVTLRKAEIPAGIDLDILEGALDSIGAIDRPPVRAKSPQVRLKQLEHAFDAGRTLKLIHALRDLALPSIPLHKAVVDAPFVEMPSWVEPEKFEIRSETATLEAIAIALGRPQ